MGPVKNADIRCITSAEGDLEQCSFIMIAVVVAVPFAFMAIFVTTIIAIIGACAVIVRLLMFKLFEWLVLQQDTDIAQQKRG